MKTEFQAWHFMGFLPGWVLEGRSWWQGAALAGPPEHSHPSTSLSPFPAGHMEYFVFRRHAGVGQGQQLLLAALCAPAALRGERW